MSELNETVADQLRDAGLLDQREYLFAGRLGRKWRLDFAWPRSMLAVEIEGGAYILGRHVRGAGFEADAVKYNYAALCGWRVLRFGPAAVRAGVVPLAVSLHLTKHTSPPAVWAAALATFVARSPKAPKRRSKPKAEVEHG